MNLRNMINTIHECSDIWLSDIGKLEHLQHMLHHALKFTPPVDSEGNKCGIVTMSTKKRCLSMTRLYQLVMDSAKNPLSNIPDVNTRHMIMQVLAWMWCIVFSSWVGSIVVFGISALVHAILLAGMFITVGVFETAIKRKPQYFGGLGRGNGGEHE